MVPRDLPLTTSATQLSVYASCPRRYWYRYVEHRDPERRAPGLALGSAVHSAVAWWFEERAQERTPTEEDVQRVLRADLSAATASDALGLDPAARAQLAAEADRLVRVFLAEAGDLPVIESEVRFDFVVRDPTTGEEMPRPLIGFFDAELANGRLVELKTAKRRYSLVDLRTNLQFGAYRTAARYFGVDVELIVLVRTKQPRIQRVVLPHDRDVSTWFLAAAASIERAILAGHFPPTPGATCRSCEYRRACLGAAEVADAQAA